MIRSIGPTEELSHPDSETPGLIARLSAETLTLHRHVEARLTTEGWFDDDVLFQQLLERTYVFHCYIEESCERFADQLGGLDIASRKRTPRLRSDLKRIAAEVPIAGGATLEIHDAASLLGTLYVVEGATLGGQVIVRRWAHRFADKNDANRSSFDPYGAETPARWREFCVFIDSWPGDGDLVIRAAQSAFEYYDSVILAR